MSQFQAWLAEINEYAQEDVVIMLLGNKCDMSPERVVRREDGERLAKVSDNLGVHDSASFKSAKFKPCYVLCRVTQDITLGA